MPTYLDWCPEYSHAEIQVLTAKSQDSNLQNCVIWQYYDDSKEGALILIDEENRVSYTKPDFTGLKGNGGGFIQFYLDGPHHQREIPARKDLKINHLVNLKEGHEAVRMRYNGRKLSKCKLRRIIQFMTEAVLGDISQYYVEAEECYVFDVEAKEG